jgi:hypothetical protein
MLEHVDTLLPVLLAVAVLADRDQPVDWLSPNIAPGIALMVNLSGAVAAIDTFPVVTLQDHVAFPLPLIRLKILLVVVPLSLFSFRLENDTSHEFKADTESTETDTVNYQRGKNARRWRGNSRKDHYDRLCLAPPLRKEITPFWGILIRGSEMRSVPALPLLQNRF